LNYEYRACSAFLGNDLIFSKKRLLFRWSDLGSIESKMTIVHTPRVIASVVRGLRQRSQEHIGGLTPSNPHKYQSRVGLFDIDYLGHLNNAAFLTHAEYARWEMTAANGLLQAMYNSDTHFMVTSASCRYRAQVRPLFKKFEVHSAVGGIDDKSLWMYVCRGF
jgi:hypothetical protein